MKNFQFSIFKSENGQSLITLLFFMVIGITVISAAALVVTTDILSASNTEKGLDAYYVAESGVENGILYLLRHPHYNGSIPQFPVGSGQASIQFSYDSVHNTDTITSTGTSGTTTRHAQATATYSGGSFTMSGWKEY